MITSDDPVATVAFPAFASRIDEKTARLWHALSVINVTNEDGGDGWTGSDGEMRFVDGPSTGSCPEPFDLRKNDTADAWRFGFGYDDCELRTYRISGFGELQRSTSTSAATGFARWFARTQSFRIPDQEVPGTRTVVHCRGFTIDDGMPLHCDLFSFWRAREQFAPRFGGQFALDLQHLKAVDAVMDYYQQLDAGSGAPFPWIGVYPGPVRYTIYSPDGGVLKTATPASAARDTLLRRLFVQNRIFRLGSRTVFLANRVGAYSPAILDLTILPCPGVTDPDKWMEHMRAEPASAGCVTPATKR
jgi:hypothetical protein